MKTMIAVPLFAFCCLTACTRSAAPAEPSTGPAAASTGPADAAQLKLQEYAGTNATDCGRLDVSAAEAQFKAASDCALQANQSKHSFFVAYDMPGMTVGVAGSADGRLFRVQSEGGGPTPALTSGACPAQLRVAASGRVTCFAPGDMGSMSGSHAAGAMPTGMPNPHSAGAARK